jgi:hypothetical protein
VPTWSEKRLHELGVIQMAHTPARAWNPTMIGTWATVVLIIIALVAVIAVMAFYAGVQYNRTEELERRLSVAEEASRKAELLEASKAGQVGHEEPKKERK